jgi:predicted metal-dependent phosphoesterase TrpH
VVKIDLHTHSYGSPDGGISLRSYRRLLRNKTVDYIAVTDHNEIQAAQDIQKVIGDRIIIGEEIMTNEGEIIGLYLQERIKPGLSAKATVAAIKQQKGLVYIPHPFETIRSGISIATLKKIISDVDIIELRNGRALFQNMSSEARTWAVTHDIALAASSDAHGIVGVGRTYSTIDKAPTKTTLVTQLATAKHTTKLARLPSLLSPKANRLKKRLKRS